MYLARRLPNNLKQLALGMHNYHDGMSKLPDGGTILIDARTADPEADGAEGPMPLAVVLIACALWSFRPDPRKKIGVRVVTGNTTRRKRRGWSLR